EGWGGGFDDGPDVTEPGGGGRGEAAPRLELKGDSGPAMAQVAADMAAEAARKQALASSAPATPATPATNDKTPVNGTAATGGGASAANGAAAHGSAGNGASAHGAAPSPHREPAAPVPIDEASRAAGPVDDEDDDLDDDDADEDDDSD